MTSTDAEAGAGTGTGTGAVVIRRVGAEAAGDVLAVVRSAFEARPPLEPPAAALAET